LSCIFFSVTRPGRTVASILTLNGSNDVFPPKDGPFGGHDDRWRHMGKYAPKSPQKGAWIRQFQTKTTKSIHRDISWTINPTKNRFEDRVQTTKGTSWVVRHYPKANTTWLTAAILRNGYDVIFPQWLLRFGRNSVTWCIITRILQQNGRDQNRK